MKPWTRREIARLRRLYRDRSLSQITAELGRSMSSVKNRITILELKRNIFRRPWMRKEDAALRKFFRDLPTVRVAKLVGRSLFATQGHATKLGLHKSRAYLDSPAACRLRRGDQVGRATQFPKGHVPANKGLRRPGYAKEHGRMAQTCFQKGKHPGNLLPVGTVMANWDGYLRIKISDLPNNGRGANDKNWEFVHRRVWEAAHGPIPKGHRLWWKDRNHDNCALSNLELLTDKESMLRTTIHNLPQELKDTIRLSGVLTRRIRRRLREKQTQRSAKSSLRDDRAA